MPRKKGGFDLDLVVQLFYQHQIIIKTLHFQTKYYGAHKALDVHLAAFRLLADRFMEVGQGIYGTINLKEIKINTKTLTDASAKTYLQSFEKRLKELWKKVNSHSDLMNILDEMMSDVNQLVYLLTFK